MSLCCGAIWRHREKPQHRCTTTVHPAYNYWKKDFGKFTSCRTFGAHKLLHSEPLLAYQYEIWHLLSALGCDMRQKSILYRCTSTVSALNYCGRLFSNPSAIYTKWCAQTFPPIFGLSAIFDRNFAKIVAPPRKNMRTIHCIWKSNQLLWKKALKTASKSAYKRQRNACSNYAPLERTVLRTQSVTKKNKQTKNTTILHLQPARIVRSSPKLCMAI